MSAPFPYFLGEGRQRPGMADRLPPPSLSGLQRADNYLVEPGLRDACNVALLLGQPLLLSLIHI